MKKIIALVLASVMILALVGCGSSSREIVQLTLSTEDAAAILAAAGIKLPDASETSAAGTTVEWFSWYDDIQNYSEDEIINSGYWTFQEKYGCTVEWVECNWSTRFDEIANLVLSSDSPDFYPGQDGIFDRDWTIRNNTDGGGMKEGLYLFYPGGSYMFTGPVDSISAVWGDVEAGELMFVPVPRDPNGDGEYYAEVSQSAYAIVQGAHNPEGVALLAACMRFKIVDPTVVSIDCLQLEETYLWTEDMLDMWDECYALANNGSKVIVSYFDGLGDKLCSVVSTIEAFGRAEDPTTWAQLKETYSEQIDYYVEKLNEQIEEYDPYVE